MKRIALAAAGTTLVSAAIIQKEDRWLDVARGVRAVGAFCRVTAEYKRLPWKSWSRSEVEQRQLRHETHERCADIVLQLCKSNGGIFIKLGQHAASLKGALPQEYINKLKILQDRAPQRTMEQVKAVLEEELGEWMGEIASIDPQPIGCASLAQVHRAQLQNGETVALKVQHHDLASIVQSDITLVQVLERLASVLFSGENFSLAWAVKEFEHNLQQELDFVQEANNCARSRRNFESDVYLRDKVCVPAIHWHLTTPKVICMQFFDGVPIHQKNRLQAMGVDLRQVANITLEAFAAMIFKYGFVHADPHPGNISILVQDQKESWWEVLCRRLWHRKYASPKVQLVLLDHGLYRELDESFRYNNCKLWQGMILQNVHEIKQACQGMGMGPLWELIPFMLVNRSTCTKASLGQPTNLSAEEQDKLKKKLGISNFSFRDIGSFAEVLPADMVFVMKVWHLVKDQNDALGGTNRSRFLVYARYAVAGERFQDCGFNPSLSCRMWTQFEWARFLLAFYLHELNTQTFWHLLGEAWRRFKGSPDDEQTSGEIMSMSSIMGETYT